MIGVKSRFDSSNFDIKSIVSFAPKFNTVAIKLKIDGSVMLIFSIYIPPDSTVEELKQFFDASSAPFICTGDKFLFIGDFNIFKIKSLL